MRTFRILIPVFALALISFAVANAAETTAAKPETPAAATVTAKAADDCCCCKGDHCDKAAHDNTKAGHSHGAHAEQAKGDGGEKGEAKGCC